MADESSGEEMGFLSVSEDSDVDVVSRMDATKVRVGPVCVLDPKCNTSSFL